MHHFIGNFSPCPVTDRTFFWLIASHGHHLAPLLGGDLGWLAWTRHIREPLDHREFAERDRLQADPAPAPTANRIDTHSQFSGDLRVSLPLCCRQDHSPSFRQLLGRRLSMHQRLQSFLFFLASRQFRWFGPFLHLFCSPLFPPILPQKYF